ncbi:MAG: glycerol-3-phosphate dehydrogenase [Chloroflexi bacterium]|nr:MAG: glycerol-3-phosphate dehydrogenase [Chloroflexota bacterium]
MDSAQPEATPYDVVIVGGGICGAAAALALTQGGYRILLLEQADFASGSTAASTRLVQGGLQHLESVQARRLHESLHARERLLRSRSHLVRPQPFLLPVYRDDGRTPAFVRAGLALYDLLTPRKVGPWSRGFPARAVRRMEPSLATDGLRATYRIHDGVVDLPERLCLEYLREAREGGADLRNYTSVDFILGSDGGSRAGGVDYHDVLSGQRHTAHARLVLNAAGPWVDDVLQTTGRAMRPRLRSIQGTHVVLDLAGRGPTHGLLARRGQGQSPVVVVPWLGMHIVGVAESIPPRTGTQQTQPSSHEIDGLLDAADRLLPGVGMNRSHAVYAYSGLQPWGDPAEPGSRSGRVIDHGQDGMPGLLSIVGGTLTNAAATADRAVKAVRASIGGAPRRSGPRALPPRAPANVSFLPPETMAHLRGRYGPRSPEVASYAGLDAALAEPISPYHPDIGAQVVYALEHEQARTVGDVLLRRTPVGRTGDLGRLAADRVAGIMQERLGWSQAERAQAVRDYDLELHRTLTVLRDWDGRPVRDGASADESSAEAATDERPA